jgi:predicted metal-dependent phosphoesterase TrpH
MKGASVYHGADKGALAKRMKHPGFYVQLHLHTAESSACGKSGGAEMARACKEAGYDLIVTTDHFMNANINCHKFAPWEEKVERLFAGYYAAKAEGDRIGLTVLKGWETFTKGPEFLTYGLGEDFLLAHPGIDKLGREEYLSLVHAAGGWVIHAHPFRRAVYIPPFKTNPSGVDAFEVYNAGNSDPNFNQKALDMATRMGLVQTAGADAHAVDEVNQGAMRLEAPVGDVNELFAALRGGQAEIIYSL